MDRALCLRRSFHQSGIGIWRPCGSCTTGRCAVPCCDVGHGRVGIQEIGSIHLTACACLDSRVMKGIAGAGLLESAFAPLAALIAVLKLPTLGLVSWAILAGCLLSLALLWLVLRSVARLQPRNVESVQVKRADGCPGRRCLRDPWPTSSRRAELCVSVGGSLRARVGRLE